MVERIELQVDESQAVRAYDKANKAAEGHEKAAAKMGKGASQSIDNFTVKATQSFEKLSKAQERQLSNLERKAAEMGKTAAQKLAIRERDLLGQFGGSPEAAGRVTAAFAKLRAAQTDIEARNVALARSFQAGITNPAEAAASAVSGLATSLGPVGIVAGAAAVAIGAGAFQLLSMTREFGRAAEQSLNFADRLDLTVDQAERLRIISNMAGVELGAFEGAAVKVSEALTDAAGEGKKTFEALQKLGVSTHTLTGNTRGLGPVFLDALEKLSLTRSAAERVALANDVVGKGSKQLQPLIKSYADLTAEAEKFGLFLDPSLTLKLAEADKRFDVLDQRIENARKRLAATAGTPLLEMMTRNLEDFTNSINQAIAKWEFFRGLVGFGPGRQPVEAPSGIRALVASQERGTTKAPPDLAAIKAAEAATKRAAEIDKRTQAESLSGLSKIVFEHRRNVEELGKTATALYHLREAFTDAFDAELLKVELANLKDIEKIVESINEESLKAAERRGALFSAGLDFERSTIERHIETNERMLAADDLWIQRGRDAALANLEFINTHTVQGKLAAEQQRLAIETDFLQRSTLAEIAAIDRRLGYEIEAERRSAAVRGVSAQALELRIDAINRDAAERARALEQQFVADRSRVEIQAQVNQVRIVEEANQQLFDRLKNLSDRTFGDMLAGGGRMWDGFKNAALSAFRDILSSQVARLLFRVLTGQTVGFAQGGGVTGRLGGLLGTLGLGSVPAFGGGGGVAGAGGVFTTPSNVPGLPGGVSLATGAAGGSAGVAGLAGLAPLLGLGGSLLGLKGAFAAGQSGNRGLKIGAPFIGAAAGLLGFGSLSFLFPALIAAGPIGWIIAGGVGATIGLIGIFKKTAEQKVIDKVQQVYGLRIDKNLAKHILGIAQNMGGLDVAIGSPEIRNLLELYAMSTGQSFKGQVAAPHPFVAAFSGGRLFEQQGFTALGSALGRQSAFPLLGGGSGGGATSVGQKLDTLIDAVRESHFIQLDPNETTRAWRGEAVQAMRANPRVVSQTAEQGYRASARRRETIAVQLSPGLVTS